MSTRLATAVVTTCLCTSALAQSVAPELTRQQRDLLQTIVNAVDQVDTAPIDAAWLIHVLRASDGSHYVAFSLAPPPASLPSGPMMLYVRLSTAATGETRVAERSLVREWLKGSRIDPRLLPPSGMVIGEMPPMGAGAIGARGGAAVGSADLQAMDLQRERARQRREADEKKRRATLEGLAAAQSDRFPFEDFEITAAAAFADGTRAIQRALTAGPGSYELFVAWADATQPANKARINVSRRSFQLSPAATELGLSTVIVADRIGVREAPYGALEQRAHPYAIGLTEIMPASDTVFTPNERLAVAFQVVNPAPAADGKPDLVVNMRIVHLVGVREELVASLSPLTYNVTSLPADFDVRLGHPVIAAMAVPLATVPRGEHRLLITAEDRVAKTIASSRVEFSVVGSAASLLAEAPAPAPQFDSHAALDVSIIGPLVDRIAPEAPSPALARALTAARNGRFADLLIEEPVAATEQGPRAVLSGLALLSLGDLGAMAYFDRAAAASAPPAVIDYLVGVARATQNRDAEAIERWQAAIAAGLPRALVGRWLAEAYLRRRDVAAAAAVIDSLSGTGSAPTLILAATRIATNREVEAIAALDAMLTKDPEDAEARWLLLHAMFSQIVRTGQGPRERFAIEARRYIDATGRHAALATEWLAQIK